MQRCLQTEWSRLGFIGRLRAASRVRCVGSRDWGAGCSVLMLGHCSDPGSADCYSGQWHVVLGRGRGYLGCGELTLSSN